MNSLGLFGIWDYIVLSLVLMASAGIGVYYRFTGGKQKTLREYLLADKSMPTLPVAFSLMASFMSAITLLGVSSENYSFGAQFVIINISYGLFTPVAAYLYLPVFFRLQATSAYEYLEKRFGRVARLVASFAYTIQMIFYMGIVLYAPALALEAITGISQVTAILSVGLVCTFYSTIGGMKAVLMTDVFQSILMFAAVLSIIICAGIEHEGLSGVWKIASDGGRLNFWNFNPDPVERNSWFSLTLGGGVTFLSLYAVNQTQVQRYLTVKDLKAAQKALWLNWPILTALSLATSFAGLSIYSKYAKCDPVCAGQISMPDQLMPYYVIDTMGHIPGLAGLFVAGIFSASLSSVSASLNSLAAVAIEDYYKPLWQIYKGDEVTERTANICSKFIALFYGFASLAMAFLAQHLHSVLQASLTIFGVVGGPLLGLFTLGMFTTRANQRGALLGLMSGLCLALWMAFGSPRPKPKMLAVSVAACDYVLSGKNDTLCNTTSGKTDSEYFWLYRVSYWYNSVFGLVTTCVVGYLTSWLLDKLNGSARKSMNPNLFIPPISKRMEKQWDTPLNLNEMRQYYD